jgi:hypothetical protein
VPWLALFNPEVTTSATRGYDIVYLFAADMSTVTLSLAQGVTAIRDEFKNKAAAEMLRRAALIRDRVPEFFERFICWTDPTERHDSISKGLRHRSCFLSELRDRQFTR